MITMVARLNVGVKAGGVVVVLAVRCAVDELMIAIVERLNVGVKAGGVVGCIGC